MVSTKGVHQREIKEFWDLEVREKSSTKYSFPLILDGSCDKCNSKVIEIFREIPISVTQERPIQECTLKEKTCIRVMYESNGESCTIEWTHNFEKFTSSDNKRIETREGYTAIYIDSATELDCGIYVCKITSATGSKYSSTLLTIKNEGEGSEGGASTLPIDRLDGKEPCQDSSGNSTRRNDTTVGRGGPTFAKHFVPQNSPLIRVRAGHDVHLEAKVEVGPNRGLGMVVSGVGKKPYKMEWYLDGKLHGTNSQVAFQVLDYMGIVVIDMRRINKQMCGNYKCRVWNDNGEDVSYFTLQYLTKLVPVGATESGTPSASSNLQRSSTSSTTVVGEASEHLLRGQKLLLLQHQQHQQGGELAEDDTSGNMNLEKVREVDIVRSTDRRPGGQQRRKKRPQAFDQGYGQSFNGHHGQQHYDSVTSTSVGAGAAFSSYEEEEVLRRQGSRQPANLANSSFTQSEQHATGKVKKRAGVGDYSQGGSANASIQRTGHHQPLRDQTNTIYPSNSGRYESHYEYDGPDGRNVAYYESQGASKDGRDEVSKKTEVEEHWHEEQIIFRPGGGKGIVIAAAAPPQQTIQTTQHKEEFYSSRNYSAPYFRVHLHDQNNLVEGQPVHLECRLEPKEDPDMRVDWYFNNIPLTTDRRVHTVYDYGYASLSIIESMASDSGIYVAKASNKAGEAFTTGSLCLAPIKSIITETQTTTQFDEIEMQKFRYDMGDDGGAGRERAAAKTFSRDTQVSLEPVEKAPLKFSKPTFTSRFEDTLYYKEGDLIKLDANLVPLGDKSLRVEWLRNGEPLQTNDRIKTYCDHGRVGLEIYPAELQDEGVYTCQAISDNGYAAISTRLKCIRVSKRDDTGFGEGFGLQPSKMAPAAESTGLEDQLDSMQREVTPPRKAPVPKVKPRFITRFPDYFKIHDGKPATFEAKYIPTDDPDLRVEWYHNGKPLKSGHRFRTYNESGNVALHMLYTHPQDEGIYTCRIVNKAGDDEISTSLHILDPDHGYGYKGRLSDDADKMRGVPPTLTPGEPSIKKPPGQKPSFTSKLRPIDLDEGQGIHLEAKLEPLDDTNLKVKWYKDGQPLNEGPLIKMTQDKGIVSLDMDDMRPSDSGEYLCKASNDFGEAVISAPITVHPKPKVDQGDGGWFKKQPKKVAPDTSLAPVSPIRRRRPKQREESPPPEIEDDGDLFRGQSREQRKFDTEVNLPPRFITDISDLEANEWDKIRFEARLEPANDKTMQIFWYHDGKILNASSRIKTLFDYGVLILEITDITTLDAGIYECIATNNYGSDSTRAVLRVRDDDRRIIEDTGLSSQRSSVARVKDIEETIERTIVEVAYPQSSSGMGPGGFLSPTPSSSSAFYRNQQEQQRQLSSATERISETFVKPPQRPLFVTELCDVRVKEHENIRLEAQIEPRDDTTLQVGWYKNGKLMLAEETGARYRAINDFGFVILQIHDARPSDSGEYVCVVRNASGQALSKCRVVCGDDTYGQPPHFVNRYLHLENLNEGDTAHVEFRLEPADDQNMRVEWSFNGQPLCLGHRIKTLHDFGYAILDISPIYAEDSGVYECKATNLYGTKTAIAVIDCKGKRNAVLDTHIPAPTPGDEQQFSRFTSQQEQWVSRADLKLEKREKPIFTTPLQKFTNLREGESAHFVTTVEPANDSDLRINWFVDGKPITSSSSNNRIKLVHNFGYVVLDISPVHASDSGSYVCVAENAYGQDTVSGTLLCKPVERIEPPRFRVPLKNVELNEGQTSNFKAILEPSPDPSLRIEWYFNDEPLLGSTRFRPARDANVATLNISPTYKEDTGTYKIVVTNAEGRQSAVSTATLKCYPKPVLPAPKFIAPLTLAVPSTSISITKKIESQSNVLKEGRSAIIETQLSPGVEADVEWFLDDRSLKDTTRFRAVRDTKSGYVGLQNLYVYYPEDGGRYTVKARNESGSDQVSSTFVAESESLTTKVVSVSHTQTEVSEVVKEKPRFISKLSSTSVTEGESVRFECKVTGSPAPTVEWRINETVVVHGPRFRLSHERDQGGTYETYTLEIPDTKAYDTGDIKVVAYNSEGQITASAQLNVARREKVVQGEAPRFTKKLIPINTVEGQSAVFDVQFTGTPAPQVKWMRERFEIHDSHDFRITTTDHSSTLVIRQACVEDTGIFSCNLLNTAGWGECAANLNVQAEIKQTVSPNVAPTFITPLEPQLVGAGDTAIFECRIAGFPQPQVTWYKGGLRLTENVRTKFLQNGTDRYSLIISHTMPADIGVYECVAVNAAGEARGRANLQINVPPVDENREIERIETIVTEPLPFAPRLTQPLRDYIAMEGQSALFQCSILGYPAPTIKWYKGDSIITADTAPMGAYVMSEAKDGVFTLKLSECYLEDEAIYSCEATNSSGTIKTSARLRVQQVRPDIEGPSFIRSIDSTRVKLGQPVTFTCSITGKPKPEVTWFKDGLEIVPSTKYQLSYTGTTSKLTIHDTKEPEDNGTYVCKAKNIGGTAECSAALLVECKTKPVIILKTDEDTLTTTSITTFKNKIDDDC